MSRTSSDLSTTALPCSSNSVTGNDLSTDMNDIETDVESNYNSNTNIPSKRKRGRPPKLGGSGTPTANVLMSPIPTAINLNPAITNTITKSIPSSTMKTTSSSSATAAVNNTTSSANLSMVAVTPAVPKKQSSHRNTEMKLSLQHASSDSYDFAYGSKNIGSVRRSRRYRPPDPSKEIPIIYPHEDAVQRFNINESEVTDFNACLNDPIDLIEMDEENENIPKKHFDPMHAIVVEQSQQSGQKGDIFVPNVVEIKNEHASAMMLDDNSNGATTTTQIKFTLPEMGTDLPGYRYNDYDIDEEDMEFITQLNQYFFISGQGGEEVVSRTCISFEEMERYLTILEKEV